MKNYLKMIKTKKSQRGAVIAVAIILTLIFISGCAPKTRIRASDTMFQENPARKIAVFAEGKVNWPRMGKGGLCLGVSDSKKSLTALLSQTEQVLSNKGYEVVFAEPVGIGYNSHKWWLIPEEEGEYKEGPLELIEDSKPVFVYPRFQDNQEFSKAVHTLIEELELALKQKQLNTFDPPKKAIEVIRQTTAADTICLNRIYGKKFSGARKTGAVALGVLGAMFGVYGAGSTVRDMIDCYFIFIDTKTGEVLWQYGIYASENPINPSKTFVKNVLKHFPKINTPFDKNVCIKGKDGFVYCK